MPPFSASARHVLNHGHARAIRAALFFKSAWTCAHLLVQVAVDKTKRQQVHGYQTCRKKNASLRWTAKAGQKPALSKLPYPPSTTSARKIIAESRKWLALLSAKKKRTWSVLCDFCMEEKSALWGWAWQKQTMWSDRWSHGGKVHRFQVVDTPIGCVWFIRLFAVCWVWFVIRMGFTLGCDWFRFEGVVNLMNTCVRQGYESWYLDGAWY